MSTESASKALASRGEVGTVRQQDEDEPADPTSLVRYAIEQRVPVEMLERLVALQERVSARNARAAFFAALARVQEEVGPIKKSATAEIATKSGARYSYTYAPLDAIADAVRPVLARHGFSYSWNSEDDGARVRVTCYLRHVEGHTEDATFSAPTESEARMSGAQKHAAALTFGRRMSLVQVLGISTTDEDTDGAPGRQQGGERITEGQAADLLSLMNEVGADEGRFLAFMRVAAVEDIRADDYRRAVDALEQKRRGRK